MQAPQQRHWQRQQAHQQQTAGGPGLVKLDSLDDVLKQLRQAQRRSQNQGQGMALEQCLSVITHNISIAGRRRRRW
jgi:hypothetical protein